MDAPEAPPIMANNHASTITANEPTLTATQRWLCYCGLVMSLVASLASMGPLDIDDLYMLLALLFVMFMAPNLELSDTTIRRIQWIPLMGLGIIIFYPDVRTALPTSAQPSFDFLYEPLILIWVWALLAIVGARSPLSTLPATIVIWVWAMSNHNSFTVSVLGICAILCTLMATTLSAQNTVGTRQSWRALARMVVILMAAIPFAMAIFFIFPRVDLGDRPSTPSKGVTGLSANMRPGSVSQLAQSNELAFSASFRTETSVQDLYWRATVLDHYDGVTWTKYPETTTSPTTPEPTVAAQSIYEIDLPSTMNSHLPLLDATVPGSVTPLDNRAITLSASGIYSRPAGGSTRIMATLNPGQPAAPGAPPTATDLLLPEAINPRTRAMAHQWATQDHGDARKIVARFETMVTSGDFRYTFTPPQWGANGVDQFLFDQPSGFCEHYAGALVFFMRAAGIPSRVITGYHGGDSDGTDVRVLAKDAHAWTEIWTQDKGWWRVDPTQFIHPSNIDPATKEKLQWRNGLLVRAQVLSDRARAGWQHLITQFDEAQKRALLLRWLDDPLLLLQRLGALLLAAFTSIGAVHLGRALKRYKRKTPEQRLSESFIAVINKTRTLGIDVPHNPTANTLINALNRHHETPVSIELRNWLVAYNHARYHTPDKLAVLSLVKSAHHFAASGALWPIRAAAAGMSTKTATPDAR